MARDQLLTVADNPADICGGSHTSTRVRVSAKFPFDVVELLYNGKCPFVVVGQVQGGALVRTRYLRRHFIELAVREFRPDGDVIELGSGQQWRYCPKSLTVNIDAHAKPDIVADVEKLQLDQHFDCALALEVIEHTREPWAFITATFNLLKPGGRALFTVPFTFEIHAEHDYWRFTRQQLARLFADWTDVRIEPQGRKYSVICHFLRLSPIGRIAYPLLNNLGVLLDALLRPNDRITLGYAVTARRPQG